MEDPINSDPNPNSLPIPPLDYPHLDFNGVVEGDDDEFLFNLDFDFSVDDLTFADDFLIEPDNPNSSLSHDGSHNPNSDFSPKSDPNLNNGPISSEESNFGPGSGSGSGCADSGNTSDRDVSSNLSQNSKINEGSKKLCKRKKEIELDEVRISKVKKFATENSTVMLDGSNNNCNQNEDDDEKRKARLIRNRESAQLSRQRKKQYVEELEDKVRSMHSTITELNGKISFIMAENASLRHQLSTGVGGGGGGVAGSTPPPPPGPAMGAMGMYPIAPMPYPWMAYSPYMVKPQGSHVPLVPIPRLKPQQQGSGLKGSKKSEGKKKRVASVSLLGLLFFMLLFGGLVPIVNVKYGGIGDGFGLKKGNVYMVDRTTTTTKTMVGGHGRVLQQSNSSCDRNSSEPLVASLYVPRNDKLVKIDGNLIIHSVLASEKAKATKIIDEGEGSKGSEETGLAIHGSYPPYPTPGPGSNDWRHPHLDRNQNGRQRALGSSSSSDFTPVGSDGNLQQWFREGLAGPMLSSGMCTEVFQFDISPTPGSIVPASSISNITSKNSHNSTSTNKSRNRRILHEHAMPLDGHTLNTTEIPQEHTDELQGNNSSSSMVVSVLVDPREVGDGDGEGVIRSKTMSRIFVVVLIDSVKYVTYSCMLPFMGSGNHLVTT